MEIKSERSGFRQNIGNGTTVRNFVEEGVLQPAILSPSLKTFISDLFPIITVINNYFILVNLPLETFQATSNFGL